MQVDATDAILAKPRPETREEPGPH